MATMDFTTKPAALVVRLLLPIGCTKTTQTLQTSDKARCVIIATLDFTSSSKPAALVVRLLL
jgi:hypothetical protein